MNNTLIDINGEELTIDEVKRLKKMGIEVHFDEGQVAEEEKALREYKF